MNMLNEDSFVFELITLGSEIELVISEINKNLS